MPQIKPILDMPRISLYFKNNSYVLYKNAITMFCDPKGNCPEFLYVGIMTLDDGKDVICLSVNPPNNEKGCMKIRLISGGRRCYSKPFTALVMITYKDNILATYDMEDNNRCIFYLYPVDEIENAYYLRLAEPYLLKFENAWK